MFLFIVRERASNCAVQEKFQHFGDTVSHVFYKILTLLLHLYIETVNLPIKDDALQPRIPDNRKYFLYFQNCLGALDSTHIPAHVLTVDGAV